MTEKNRTNRFSRINRVVTCTVCGKRTTSNMSGGGNLCAKCYDVAGIENEHSDGYHNDEPHPDCPTCNEASETATAAIKRVTPV